MIVSPSAAAPIMSLCVVLAACGGAEPAQEAAERTPEIAAARAPDTSSAERDLASGRSREAQAPLVEAAKPEVVEVSEAGPAEVGAAKERAGEPSVVTPLPQLCREACANAHRLVLAELPVDTAKAMRDEIERVLERECPGSCLQRASIESARCFVSAKSALELAACPQ